MKPVVVRSINDVTEQRCVDLIREGADFGYVECRRDPEDSHGWRRLSRPVRGFATLDAAVNAARADIAWLAGRA